VKWIALSLAAIAAVLLGLKYESPRISEAGPPVPIAGAKSRQREGALSQREIVRLRPEDWRERFRRVHPDLPGETRQDILQLAAGLQDHLAEGGDPQGEDARVFGDAIRALMDHGEEGE
jgi:hypothetical protein